LKSIIGLDNTEEENNENEIIKEFTNLFKINITVVNYNEP